MSRYIVLQKPADPEAPPQFVLATDDALLATWRARRLCYLWGRAAWMYDTDRRGAAPAVAVGYPARAMPKENYGTDGRPYYAEKGTRV